MSFFNRLGTLFAAKGKKSPLKKAKKLDKDSVKKTKVGTRDGRFLVEAKTRAKEIILEAKEEAFQIKKTASEQLDRSQRELRNLDQKIQSKQAEIQQKIARIKQREEDLEKDKKRLFHKRRELEEIKEKELSKLERIASLSKEKAKKLLLQAWEKKLEKEIALQVREEEEKAKQIAEQKAQEILVDAMQRGATDYVPEYTVSTVKLRDEEMKGRIIGREGRNIRAFEKATGVDVDLDEEGVIRLSSFDSVRREIARVALEKLIGDGRIQPVRIEEIVKKTKKDINRIIHQSGEELCHRVKVYNLPREIMDTLGRFHYRSSYGQNMISHTLEETKIGVALAYEVKADINVVRLGCLLHDIGKVITNEEGSHVQIGVNFLKKYNMPRKVIDCVAQHHGDEDFSCVEAVLVYIADAISGSRPGARYEDYEEYAARLRKLEEIAKSFSGVRQAYAVQAGRELRVIVDPEEKNDPAVAKLAIDIRDKVKDQVSVPGQVKVTVIRELRETQVA